MFSRDKTKTFPQRKITALLLSIGVSAPLITGCSMAEEFKEDFINHSQGIVTVEDRMTTTEETNNSHVFEDTSENRAYIASLVEDFYVNLTSLEVPNEELETIRENYGNYVTHKADNMLPGEPFTDPSKNTDIENSLNEYSETEIQDAVNTTEQYSLYSWLTNYDTLLPVHKLMANTYIGDMSTFFAYSSVAQEQEELTNFTVNPEDLIFRANDVIVPMSALSSNVKDEVVDVVNVPLRIILLDGSWKVDVFNAATIYHSPLMLKIHMRGNNESTEQSVDIVTRGLTKDWNMDF